MNLPLFGAMVILNMVKDICQLLTRVNLDQKQELCLRRVLKIGWVSQNGAGQIILLKKLRKMRSNYWRWLKEKDSRYPIKILQGYLSVDILWDVTEPMLLSLCTRARQDLVVSFAYMVSKHFITLEATQILQRNLGKFIKKPHSCTGWVFKTPFALLLQLNQAMISTETKCIQGSTQKILRSTG